MDIEFENAEGEYYDCHGTDWPINGLCPCCGVELDQNSFWDGGIFYECEDCEYTSVTAYDL